MAKKKKVNKQTYDEMMQSSGKATTYEGMMSDKDRFNRKGVYSAIANDIKKREEQKEQNLSNARTKTWQGVTANARWDSQGDRSGEAYAAKMIRDTPGAYERKKKKLIDELTAGTTAWKKASQDAKYGAGGQDNSYDVYAAKMINDTPGAYEREVKRINKGALNKAVSNSTKVVRDASTNARYNADGTDNSYTIYAAKMIKDSSQKEDKSAELNKFLSGLKENKLKKQATDLAQGTTQKSSWLGETPDEMKEVLSEKGAQKTWEEVEKWRDKGAFDKGSDKKLWSQGKRASERKINDSMIGQYQSKIDENQQMLQEGNEWYPTLAEESAGDLFDELQERGMDAYAHTNKDRTGKAFAEMFSMGGNLSEDAVVNREIVFNRLFGKGNDSYQNTVEMLDDEQRAWLDDKLDEIADGMVNPYDPTGYEKEIQDAEEMLSYYEDQNKELDWLDKRDQNYASLMESYKYAAGGDTAYHPELNVAKNQQTYWDKGMGMPEAPVDTVYAVLGGGLQNVDITTGDYHEAALMSRKPNPETGLSEYDTFMSLYNSGKKNEAWAFYQGLQPTLNQRYSYYEAESLENTALQLPVLSSIATVFAAPVQSMEYIKNMAGRIEALVTGKENAATDPYSSAYVTTRTRNISRNAITKALGDWGWVYSGVMSGADSAFNVAIAKGLGLAGKTIEIAGKTVDALQFGTLALFGTQAFETSLQQKLDEGGGNFTYDLIEAYIDAAIETATEIWSVENWMADPTNILTYVTKIGISEPAEEVAGAIAGPYIKAMLGHKNEWQERAKQYYKQGYYIDSEGKQVPVLSLDDAKRQAMREWNHNIRMSAQEALISIGPAAAYGSAQIAVNTMQTGAALNSSNVNGEQQATKAMAEAAAMMGEGTESYKASKGVLDKIVKGKKVGNYQAGRMVETTVRESNEQYGEKRDEVLEQRVTETLVKEGVKTEERDEMRELVMKAINAGGIDNLTKAERKKINDNPAAFNTYLKYRFASEESAAASQEIAEKTTNERAARSVAEIMLENRQTKDNLYTGRNYADEEEAKQATGERVKGPKGVIYNGQHAELGFAKVTQDENGKPKLQYEVKIPGQGTVMADATEIRTTNLGTAALLEAQANRPGFYSQTYTNQMLLEMENKKVQNDPAVFMRDATLIRYAAMENLDMPATDLQEDVAKRLYNMTRAERIAGRLQDTSDQNRTKLKAGQGRMIYQGAEWGSKEFDEKINKLNLSKAQKEHIEFIGQIAREGGMDLRLTDLSDLEFDNSIYGTEKRSKITINLEGQNFTEDEKTGKPVPTGRHNIVVTFGHETVHFLQDNSLEGYDNLVKYVMQTQQKKLGTAGLNARISNIMTSQDLDLAGAIAEMVADSLDQIFSNEDVVKHIAETDHSLYQTLKNAVHNILQRVKKFIAGMQNSMSADARRILDTDMKKLAGLFNEAWDEATSGQLRTGDTYTQKEVEKANKTLKNTSERYSKAETYFDYDKSFRQQLVEFSQLTDKEKRAKNKYMLVGTTPDVLMDIGLPKLPILINYQHIGYMLEGLHPNANYRDDHIFDIEELAHLPEQIADPVAVIFDTKPGSVRMLVTMKAINGKQTIIPISINKQKSVNRLNLDVHIADTAYGNQNILSEYVAALQKDSETDQRLFYVNKEKTQQVISASRTNLPGNLIIPDGSIRSINESDLTVNDKKASRKTSVTKQTDTAQFRRWFGKSKVKDSDGNPRVVYHGSDAEKRFTVFKPGARGEMWFSSSEGMAYNKRKHMYASYLKIVNPYRATYYVGSESKFDPVSVTENGRSNGHDGAIVSFKIDPKAGASTINTLEKANMTDMLATDKFSDNFTFLPHGEQMKALAKEGETLVDFIKRGMNEDLYQWYTVYQPSQIKSATENIGTFDKNSDDIRYSRAAINQDGEDVTLPAMDLSRTFYFKGTDADIDAGEAKIAAREQEMKDIIEDPSFTALMLQDKPYGRYEILHPSTRKGVQFQLTYYGPDGIPNMHESYGRTGTEVDEHENIHDLSELYRHFADQSFDAPLKMKVLRENAMQGMKFSKAQVDQTRDLIAYHNLGAEQLMKVLELGGFAMPSIGITKTDYVNDRYGEISVIFKKDTIDPKKNRANKVYGGDAWTPTYPTIEYKISDKKLAQILKKVKSLIPAGMKADYVDLYEDNLQTNVNRSSGDVVKAVKDNASLMAAYLADKGEQINMPMREKALDGFGKFSNEMVIRVANVIGQDVVQQAYVESANTYQYMKEHPELIEQIRNELNAYWKEELKKKVSEGTRMKLLDKELYTEDNFGANAASNIIEAAWKYFDRGVEQQLDEYALKDSMREQIDEADYEKWLSDLFDGIIEKKGIRNNKNYYTDSGNQRSWESLHDEETLENVVKVMKAQMDKASNAFFGQSAMLALGTRDLKSIDEIKAHKGQLQHISDEELSEAKHNIVDQFSTLMDDLADPKEPNIFIARDRVLDAMVDAVRNSRTVQGITRQMKEWGYNISNEQAQLIVDLMEEIADLPTEYFEAKPQRGVGLNEIYKVLVTEDTNPKLLSALENQNIPYEYYDGTTEDRLRVMNEQDEAKFSKWTPESMDVNAWLAGASISTFQTEDERIMWQAWKDLRMKIQISMKRQLMYQEQIKALEKKTDLTAEERDQLTALRNKLEVQKNKMARLEDDLAKVTSDEGYAGMMYRNNIVLGDYIAGKTQDQVRQTVEQMVKEVQQAKAEIEKQSEELKKLAQTQAVKTMQSFFGKTSLGRMASMLRKYYNSSMQKSEIQARLAELAMKQANGEDISDGAMALAADLVDKIRGIRSDAIEQIRGTTFIIGQSLLDELKAENSSLQEIRSKVKGSGVKFQVGVKDSQTGRIVDKNSRISEQWQELRDKNGALPDVDGMAEIDKLHTIVDFIANEMSKSRGAEQFGINMDEAELFVRSAVSNVTTYLVDNPAARKQIENLMGQIRDLSNRTGRIAGTMDQLSQKMTDVETAGIKAKGWTTVLQRDVGDAIRYYNKMAQVAAQHEKQKVKTLLIDQLKSENTAKLIKQQRKYEQMMKDDRTARQLAMDNEMLRRRIHTVTNRMAQRLFAETDIKNIPEETKPLARLVLGMIEKNDSIYRRATYYNRAQLNDMHQRLLKMIATFGDFDYNSDLDWLIIKGPTEADNDYDVYDRIVKDLMDIEQGLLEYHSAEGQRNITLMDRKNALTKVQTALSEIWSAIQARGQAEIDGRKWQVMELALQMDEDMQGSKFKGERIGKTRKVKDAVTNAVGYGNLTPVYFIKNLKNRTMSLLYRGLETGENRSGLEVRKAQAAIEKIATETGFINWDGQEKHKVNVSGGKTIELTTEQIMALYATWKRESNQMRPEETSHLRNGGFVISEDLDKGISGRKKIEQVPIRMSKDALNSLGSYLTDAQREYVDRIVEYLSTDMAELGNEASMKMYGIKKFTEQFYFPIKSWGGVMNSRSDAGVRNNNENRAAQQGFSKRVRANANNAIEIGDFTPTAMKHIAGMINYNTVGPAIENINKVLNQQLQYGELTEEEDTRYKRNMRTAFQQHYGTQAYKYLEKFMGDMNGGVNRGQGNNPWDKLLGVFKKMSVAGSLSVAAQQPLSYIRAAMLINPKYLAKALMTEWKGAYKELMQYSGLAVIKDMGRFDMNYGQSAAEYITPEAKMSKGKAMWKWLGDKSTALPQKMDALTWTRMWVAVKAEQAALHPEMDVRGEEFLNMAAERFNDVMRRTQVYDSVMVKSQNMRDQHPFAKTITSFMAEPTLSLNVLADAWQNKGEKGGKANAVKALGTFILSAIAQAAVKGFFSTGRTPDKKKNQEENFLYKFTYNLLNEANVLSLVPGFSQLMDLLKNGELTDNSLGVIGKAKDAISEIGKLIKGGEEYKWYRGVEDSIGQVLQMATNIPAKNFMRDLRAMGNFFSGGRLESITGGTYANRPTSPAVLKYQLIDQLMTEDLIGVVNKELGDAGYGTKNEDYYKRIYNAEKAGNTQDAEDMKEYLLMGKGVKDEKAINDGLRKIAKADETISEEERTDKVIETSTAKGGNDYVISQVKEGKISASEARKKLKEIYPDKDDEAIWWTVDRAAYTNETGIQPGSSSYYYRLKDAIESNKSDNIKEAVQLMVKHGVKESDIKSWLGSKNTGYKQRYIESTGAERTKMQDALTKAYKAIGLTADEALKIMNKWIKDAEKKK